MKRIGLILMAILLMAPKGFSQIINVPADQPSIQAGINAASDRDTVLVADSTYFENINFLGKAITVASYFLVDGDTSHITNTIIDGSQPIHPDTSSAVLMISGEDSTSVLCGFTVTHGKGTVITLDDRTVRAGGGILILGSGGLIYKNNIIHNSLKHHWSQANYNLYSIGNGICAQVNDSHTLLIRNNWIKNNGYGGSEPASEAAGMCIIGGRIIIEDNTISENSLGVKFGAKGGGIVYWGSDEPGVIQEVTIRNNVIAGNGVEEDGGTGAGAALFLQGNDQDVNFQVYNNLILDNLIDYGSDSYRNGTGIFIQGIEASFVNNTIVNSEVGNNIYLDENASIILFNNIIWCGGEGITKLIARPDRGNTITANYNLIQGGWEGEGNIDADPIFESDSFSLAEGSPGIGYGKDSIEIDGAWYHTPSKDFYGNSRPHPIDKHVDLGAIESLYEGHVYIPDTAFLHALIDEGVDTNEDGLISYAEAEAMISIDVSEKGITDMTGIEAFVNLDTLNCHANPLASLDVSKNAGLKFLYCSSCGLNSLDVSKNIALETLSCGSTYGGPNYLTSLDISNNTALESLNCKGNLLTSLDVSNNTALTELILLGNQLTSLDISNNTALTELFCAGNPLTNLDISNNTELNRLDCRNNPLTNLDVSNNTELTSLICNDNQLTSLDVSNNDSITTLWIGGMPSLHEVCVREMPFPPSGVDVDTNGSPNVYFTTECGNNIVSIPDTAFLHALIDEGVDTNGDSLISYAEAEAITLLDLSGNFSIPGIISDIEGIEAFVNLDSLKCGSNQITSLDATSNLSLKLLWCNDNQLTSLDVTNYTTLTDLWCSENQLTSLDVTNNAALSELLCRKNGLATLDVTNNVGLNYLNCGNNEITSLDVTENVLLTELVCQGNQLSSLDVTQNLSLRRLWGGYNLLTSLDVSKNSALVILWCDGNQLSSLDVSSNPSLEDLWCSHNLITDIDLTNNPLLTMFMCGTNFLNTLDASSNPALKQLRCMNNQLTSINVSNNADLEYLMCSNNQLTSLDVSNNTSLEVLWCGGNQLNCLDISTNTAIGSGDFMFQELDISNMPTLYEVCVWTMPFPPAGVSVSTSGSPNVSYTDNCSGSCNNGLEGLLQSSLSIYPNPTSDVLTIVTDHTSKFSIEITTLNGQRIYTTLMEGSSHQIDLSIIQKGIYFVTVKSKDFVTTRKIIKL